MWQNSTSPLKNDASNNASAVNLVDGVILSRLLIVSAACSVGVLICVMMLTFHSSQSLIMSMYDEFQIFAWKISPRYRDTLDLGKVVKLYRGTRASSHTGFAFSHNYFQRDEKHPRAVTFYKFEFSGLFIFSFSRRLSSIFWIGLLSKEFVPIFMISSQKKIG